jgi:hypothetical protein
MRSFAMKLFAVALALAPATAAAQQQPPAQQPPAQQPPAAAQTQQPPPAAPKIAFTTPGGMLLVQIKPDQTAVFEEMATKLKAGLAKTQDATLKQQAAGLKIYKASEPMGANALYVVEMDPAVPSSEYDLFVMLQHTMTPDEQRAPETADMFKRYASAFAASLGKLSLTPVGGGM